ncbi:GntR family transcriptional regulator [Ornithinibacillus halotolerans]|uniref:HTH-type transcriptional regulator YhcF n=1 Tax=Ornithinibacillus halotolerans TaxID=1274357 RepID=A0A916WAD2_9BACI|nr:GntR family transcriptional regulator [Ornithinibacillus halotolerans]GGA80350.1 putative HTH-type transcriptional regulator YhcF [Ornithinibacillus halotolerans]
MADMFHSQKPIYQQLADRIKKQIISGELSPGEKLPSIRETGLEVNVNPNTVSRTYRELEMVNIVETKRGQGTFVTEDEGVLRSIREEMKNEIITIFVQEMQEMGYTNDDIQSGLGEFLSKKGENEA